jgi:hypothetical protein
VKPNRIEVLPSPQEMRRAPVQRDELEKLVQQKLAEIMADRDALVFEPFFRSRQVAYELKRLQSVPEQEKFSISYERYGCMDCKTHASPHAGNNMCHACRSKWFRRLAQIIGEGIKGEPAQRARGTARSERLLPENASQDRVHRSWYQRSTEQELLLYGSVAERLGVTPSHVRAVDLGKRYRNSEHISAALKEERARILANAERLP